MDKGVSEFLHCKDSANILESDRSKEIDLELPKYEVSRLRSITGQLSWATSQAKPDVAFEGCQVGNYGKHHTVQHFTPQYHMIY